MSGENIIHSKSHQGEALTHNSVGQGALPRRPTLGWSMMSRLKAFGTKRQNDETTKRDGGLGDKMKVVVSTGRCIVWSFSRSVVSSVGSANRLCEKIERSFWL